ncbi:MAG: DNA topoisomerase IV subunit A [Candidatus Binatia bacterium]|nr:DNA topoisomerase IV subunit A [Candidatus Binatia bacterium]
MEGETRQADLRTTAEQRYLSYALSVITARALPDARDGLKPVQRRILFAMFQNLRLVASAKARKSAQIVGEVIGKYHPHGDVAAYDAMVRMAQDFSLRYPLVHGEGNFGSLDGDQAAAYRYTEARLTAIAEEILADLGADTVDWRPTYDASNEEPIVLPSRLPQLLMNGSTGIAVGMATNIPPHNLTEICNALVALVDAPKLEVTDLLKHIKGPDFPTGGELLSSRAEIRSVYETGTGALRVRGEYKIEKAPRGKVQIILTSIPYAVNKATLVERIGGLIIERKLPQVVDVRDESTDEIRVVLELKADIDPQVAMAFLFKHTDLQVNFNVNLTCLTPSDSPSGASPERVSLLDLCQHFLDFRMDVVTRRLEFEKRKLEARLHILEGFHKIHLDLDKAIRIIRRAEGRADAAKKLKVAFKLEDVQVDAILELRLYQLARLEIDKLEAERKEKQKRLAEVDRLLKRKAERWKMIRRELLELKEKYGDARRTKVSMSGREDLVYDPDAYIVHEETTVLLTRDGWIRRVRELKDPSTARLREGDSLEAIHVGTTRDRIVLFSTLGVLYVLPASDVPATTGYGEPVQSLFKFKDGERVIRSMLVVEGGAAPTPKAKAKPKAKGKGKKAQANLFNEGDVIELTAPTKAILVASARGYGFQAGPDLSPTTRSGRRFARVAAGDELISIHDVTGKEVFCLAKSGKGVRFPLSDVADLSGVGRGVILMRLDSSDKLLGAVSGAGTTEFRVGIAKGSLRGVRGEAFPQLKRGAKGQKVIKRGTPESIAPPEN